MREFEGTPTDGEVGESLALLRLTTAERLSVAVLVTVTVAVTIVLPLLRSGDGIHWAPLVFCAFLLIVTVVARRRQSESVESVGRRRARVQYTEEALVIDGETIPFDGIRRCRLGDRASVIWIGSRPALITESMFTGSGEWQALRGDLGKICRASRRRHALTLGAVACMWIGVLVAAIYLWDALS